MNFTKHVLLLAVLLITYSAKGQSWAQKTDMTEGREGAVCFSLNGKVYWGGGTATYQADAKADFYEYDPATDQWKQLGNMPEERLYGIAFTINGKGYVGLGKQSGGGFSNYLQTLYEYDPGTDKWSQKASMPAPYGLVSCAVFVVNNKAYVLGGTNANSASYGTLYEYDPGSDQWATKAPYPLTIQGNNWIRQPMTFGIGNKGYVIAGEIRAAAGLGSQFTKKCFEYDPTSDTWTPIADYMGDGRAAGNAFSINGMGFCGLGYQKDPSFNTTYYKDVYVYNPNTDQWVSGGDFPGDARVLASSTVIGNKGYVGGGSRHQTGYYKDWHELTIPTAISNHTKDDAITLYPNPAKDAVHLDGDVQFSDYRLYNITGKLIKEGMIKSNLISIDGIATGSYIIKLTGDEGSYSRLLQIQE